MMGEVYASASRVLAYIGEEFEGCQLAAETMEFVSKSRALHFDAQAGDVLMVRGVPFAAGGVPWDSIWKFLETPW